MITLERVTLEGAVVRLVPVGLEHVDGLAAVGLDPDLWRWMPLGISRHDEMERWVRDALAAESQGHTLAFTIVHRETGEVVGATRFLAIVPEHRRVEIGGTWIASAWQRSAVNSEAKYLMLRHAFEVWGCLRVEFKTHAGNARSRAAITRLGAVEEGVFRKHMVQPDGTSRDSAYYSIVDTEWPAVKARLEAWSRRG